MSETLTNRQATVLVALRKAFDDLGRNDSAHPQYVQAFVHGPMPMRDVRRALTSLVAKGLARVDASKRDGEYYFPVHTAAIAELEAEFGGPWNLCDDGSFEYEGEPADGGPNWKVDEGGGVFSVTCTIGWYEPQGEADGQRELIALMHAIIAAKDALNASMAAALR